MPTWTDYRSWLADAWQQTGEPDFTPPPLARLVTDSRTLEPGDVFVALSGDRFDGHAYLSEVIAKGASGFFFASSRAEAVPAAMRAKGLAVSDPLLAYQRAARGWRSTLTNLTIAALTGSSGKTTTKELTSAILAKAAKTLATPASFNNEVGVPKTLAMLREDHRFAVVEMGARMPGNIRFLCDLVQPNVCGIVNVGTAHLGVFGSPQALLDTKLEIYRDSGPNAVLVANADDPRILNGARATKKRVLSFGQDPRADVQLVATEWLSDGSMRLTLRCFDQVVRPRLGVAHEAFAIDAAVAAALALASGASSDHVDQGLEGFTGIKGRYQVHRLARLTLVDDTYNANPDSMIAGLTAFARAFHGKHKTIVLGDMLELGPDSAAEHRRIGAFCAQHVAPDLLVAVGRDAEHVIAGARAHGLAATHVKTYTDVEALLGDGLPLAGSTDAIYAKASNGVKLVRLIDALLHEERA